MDDFLTDEQINNLIQEIKPLPDGLVTPNSISWKSKLGHKEAQYELTGQDGNDFRIILRQNQINALDFSIILAYLPKETNQLVRLRRYNGKSHEHTNRIEKDRFYNFHTHTATERYQRENFAEDGHAILSTKYSNLFGAVNCLANECGFQLPSDYQPPLI